MSRPAAHRRAGEFLALVQLVGFADRRVDALSGGEAQRAALARALAAEPEVLLLDEPFSALDLAIRDQVHELLREVRTTLDPTLLLVTHAPEEATLLGRHRRRPHRGAGAAARDPRRPVQRAGDRRGEQAARWRYELPGEVRAGRHRSALGETPTDLPDGPATLVVRQEAIEVLTDADPAGAATGWVVDVRRLGARQLLLVQLSGTVVHAEIGAGRSVDIGTRVGLHPAAGGCTVLPEPPTAPGGSARPTDAPGAPAGMTRPHRMAERPPGSAAGW